MNVVIANGNTVTDSLEQDNQNNNIQMNIVKYPPSFFNRYQPVTALDIVKQVPGFLLDDGDDLRGFGGGAGNVLIDGRRPTAKQDLPSEILARIPSRYIKEIELIRGQVQGVDLQGHNVLVNIILEKNISGSTRWETYLKHNNRAPIEAGASITLSENWRGIDFNTGLIVQRDAYGEDGTEEIYNDEYLLTESSIDKTNSFGIDVMGNFNASTWLGDTLFQINTNSRYNTRNSESQSKHNPKINNAISTNESIVDDFYIQNFEFGADAERIILKELMGKIIFLYSHEKIPKMSTRRIIDNLGQQQLYRQVDTTSVSQESILRLELDWKMATNHMAQLNLESALNILSNSLIQIENLGNGQQILDIPGANTRVEESRLDIQSRDTISYNNIVLNLGLGIETSLITQTGDTFHKRNFFYLKPEILFTYAYDKQRQTRVNLVREVAQLDFSDFVSSTVFEDDDLALGNPDLRPETTWIANLSHEKRFGETGVLTISLFHHWISNVQDLLPTITREFEVPGNIGKGKRWGVELISTLPLEIFGLVGSRFDLLLRYQDTSVIDPVTSKIRNLSGEAGYGGYSTLSSRNKNNKYHMRLDYRQDFETQKFSWGWSIAQRAERPLYRVNELDIYNENYALDAFIESTQWNGIKINVSAENILDKRNIRERSIYASERELSPIDSSIYLTRHNGRRITLSMSSNFN